MELKLMHGHIFIYVDGYRNALPTAFEINVPQHSWEGWAVGVHRYCSRAYLEKMRRFESFDEAVAYIDKQRRKRPHERFQLMYCPEESLPGHLHPVSSLDEILQIDQQVLQERTLRREWVDEMLPALEQLKKFYKAGKAARLSMFLREVQEKGVASVRANAKSSFYKAVKDLHAAGVTLPD